MPLPGAISGVPRLRFVIARRDGSNEAIDLGDRKAVGLLFVRDNEDEIAPGLIEATNGAVFDARDPNAVRLGRIFKALYGSRVRLVSEAHYELLVNSTPFEETQVEHTVTTVCPWLRVITAVALEALKGAEAHRLPADRSAIIGQLERVGLYFANHIGFRIDGRDVPPGDWARPAFSLKDAEGRALVVALHEGEVTWAAMEAALKAISEAIDQPTLVPHMRLLARELAELGENRRTSRLAICNSSGFAAPCYLKSRPLPARGRP